MNKKLFKTGLLLMCTITLGTVLLPTTAVLADEVNNSTEQTSNQIILTPAEERKAQAITDEVNRLNNLPEQQRNEEIEKTLAEAEGQEFYFGEQSVGMSRAAASTNAKVINGGLNFFAYNKEGVNKLGNTFASGAAATGGITAVAGIIAKFAPGISVKVAASILTGFSGMVTKRLSDARGIIRSRGSKGQTKAGARITATETLDITNKGIDAYR